MIYDGIRVLDISSKFGMYCGKLLAGMGAEVIKIEPPKGCAERYEGPLAKGVEEPEASLKFAYLNTGKKSIVLDISKSEDKENLIELIKSADILIESFKPGYTKSHGFDYDSVKSINPELIYASITPFGQEGPHSQWMASSEMIPYAMTGSMYERGKSGHLPLCAGHSIPTNAACFHILVGIQAALYARKKTNRGSYLDFAMEESFAQWRTFGIGDYQVSGKITNVENSQNGIAPSGMVRCKDGVQVYIITATKWEESLEWCKEFGVDVSELEDPKYIKAGGYNKYRWQDIDKIMSKYQELAMNYTSNEFMEEGQKRRMPAGVVSDAQILLSDKHFEERKFFEDIKHPLLGTLHYSGAPYKFTASPMDMTGRAPLLGEHTDEILRDLAERE